MSDGNVRGEDKNDFDGDDGYKRDGVNPFIDGVSDDPVVVGNVVNNTDDSTDNDAVVVNPFAGAGVDDDTVVDDSAGESIFDFNPDGVAVLNDAAVGDDGAASLFVVNPALIPGDDGAIGGDDGKTVKNDLSNLSNDGDGDGADDGDTGGAGNDDSSVMSISSSNGANAVGEGRDGKNDEDGFLAFDASGVADAGGVGTGDIVNGIGVVDSVVSSVEDSVEGNAASSAVDSAENDTTGAMGVDADAGRSTGHSAAGVGDDSAGGISVSDDAGGDVSITDGDDAMVTIVDDGAAGVVDDNAISGVAGVSDDESVVDHIVDGDALVGDGENSEDDSEHGGSDVGDDGGRAAPGIVDDGDHGVSTVVGNVDDSGDHNGDNVAATDAGGDDAIVDDSAGAGEREKTDAGDDAIDGGLVGLGTVDGVIIESMDAASTGSGIDAGVSGDADKNSVIDVSGGVNGDNVDDGVFPIGDEFGDGDDITDEPNVNNNVNNDASNDGDGLADDGGSDDGDGGPSGDGDDSDGMVVTDGESVSRGDWAEGDDDAWSGYIDDNSMDEDGDLELVSDGVEENDGGVMGAAPAGRARGYDSERGRGAGGSASADDGVDARGGNNILADDGVGADGDDGVGANADSDVRGADDGVDGELVGVRVPGYRYRASMGRDRRARGDEGSGLDDDAGGGDDLYAEFLDDDAGGADRGGAFLDAGGSSDASGGSSDDDAGAGLVSDPLLLQSGVALGDGKRVAARVAFKHGDLVGKLHEYTDVKRVDPDLARSLQMVEWRLKRPVVFTMRDVRALDFLTRWSYATTAQIARVGGWRDHAPRRMDRRFENWISFGFAHKHELFGGPRLWYVTQRGALHSQHPWMGGVDVERLNPLSQSHTLGLSSIASWILAPASAVERLPCGAPDVLGLGDDEWRRVRDELDEGTAVLISEKEYRRRYSKIRSKTRGLLPAEYRHALLGSEGGITGSRSGAPIASLLGDWASAYRNGEDGITDSPDWRSLDYASQGAGMWLWVIWGNYILCDGAAGGGVSDGGDVSDDIIADLSAVGAVTDDDTGNTAPSVVPIESRLDPVSNRPVLRRDLGDEIALLDHLPDLIIARTRDPGDGSARSIAVELELTEKDAIDYKRIMASYHCDLGRSLFSRVVWVVPSHGIGDAVARAADSVGMGRDEYSVVPFATGERRSSFFTGADIVPGRWVGRHRRIEPLFDPREVLLS